MLGSNNAIVGYIEEICTRLNKYFDTHKNVIMYDTAFELYAYHRNSFFKSFLTKATVYEGYSVYEHIFISSIPSLDENAIINFQHKLIDITASIVKPDKFHKKTTVIGVLLVEDTIDKRLYKHVNKFFHRKTYKFSFRGWSETQMAVVSMKDKKVYYPKHLKDLSVLLSF